MPLEPSTTPSHVLTVSQQNYGLTVEENNWDLTLAYAAISVVPNSITSSTTSNGTANLSISNVTTATATVSGTLTANHIHGNIAGTLYTHVRTGEAMSKGDPFYISDFHVGSSQPIAMRADASDPLKMPAVGVMDADYAINTSSANGIISGTLSSVDTDGYSVNSPIYVANGGGYSNTAGTIPQQVGITERANANTGAFIVTNSKVISFADVSDAQTGTAQLSLGDLEVVGGEIYTDGDYSNIYTQGDGAEIFTIGTDAIIYTQGADAHISTSGDSATIYTSGASGSIYTTGANAGISTVGTNATMGTLGTNATISTAGSAAHIQTNHASAAVKSTNFAAVESGGASLVDGSMQPCLTWSAGGRNLTIPSGTATTFNTTSYTYGTGAAAAHRTALGLDSLFDGKANLSGGNTFTGSQQINGDISSNGVAITNTAMSMRSTSGQQYVARFIGQNSGYAGFGVVATNAASKPFIQFGAGSETAANFSLVMDSGSSLSVRGGNVLGGALLTINSNTSIGINNATPNAAALLDMTSTTKGLLPPRMTTTERNVIATPPAGLVIYNTTTNNLNSYSGSAWVELVDSADLGTNVANFLEFPTSDNLASALTDENGTGGGFVRAEGATLTTPTFTGLAARANGQNIMPATGDEVINFDSLIVASQYMFAWRQGEILNTVTGSAGANSAGFHVTGTTPNSSAYSRYFLSGGYPTYISTGAYPYSGLNWTRRIVLTGAIAVPSSVNSSEAVIRVVLGEAIANTTLRDLVNRGVGLKIESGNIKLMVHNGTTLTIGSAVGTLTNNAQYFRIDSYNGTVKLYINNVLVDTTTSGPTSVGPEALVTQTQNGNVSEAQNFWLTQAKIWTL